MMVGVACGGTPFLCGIRCSERIESQIGGSNGSFGTWFLVPETSFEGTAFAVF